MSRPVLIACPKTMDLVPTHIAADSPDELPARNVLIDCPACAADHEWTPDDAVIVDV